MSSDRDLVVHDGPTGRREAFDEIVALHGPMVYGVALRVLRRLHSLLAGRGISCGLDPLAAFLVGESAVELVMPTGLLGNVSQRCHGLLQGQAASTAPKTAINEAFRTNMSGVIAAAVLV